MSCRIRILAHFCPGWYVGLGVYVFSCRHITSMRMKHPAQRWIQYCICAVTHIWTWERLVTRNGSDNLNIRSICIYAQLQRFMRQTLQNPYPNPTQLNPVHYTPATLIAHVLPFSQSLSSLSSLFARWPETKPHDNECWPTCQDFCRTTYPHTIYTTPFFFFPPSTFRHSCHSRRTSFLSSTDAGGVGTCAWVSLPPWG